MDDPVNDGNIMGKISYLGIITARGGSKGIPRKNIKMIAGKPLIAWTIEAAKKSKLLDRCIVSTEDREIADISRRYGAEVIDRPAELANDTATSLSVIQHVLSQIDAQNIVILQPTSPVRNEGLIDRCIQTFQNKKADNLATGFICKFMEYGSYLNQRRQDLNGFFYDDGNVYVVKTSVIQEGSLFGKNIERVHTSREENVEIDEEFDFWVAEQVLLKRSKEAKR